MQKFILDDSNCDEIMHIIKDFLKSPVIMEDLKQKSIFMGDCNYHDLKNNDNSSANLVIHNHFYKYPCFPLCNGAKIRIDGNEMFIDEPLNCLFFKKEDISEKNLISYYKKTLKYVIFNKVFSFNEFRAAYPEIKYYIEDIENIVSEEINNLDFNNLKDEFLQIYIECSLGGSDVYILNINLDKWLKTGDLNNIYFENHQYEIVNMQEELDNFCINIRQKKLVARDSVRRVTGYLGRLT